MKKKVISAILAGACALSALSFSAAAAASKDKTVTTAGSVTLKAATSLATPAIRVTVPSAISAVINPYGVAVNVKGEDYGATGIAGGTYTIKNYTTENKIKVTASGTVVVPIDKKDGNKPTIAVQTAAGAAAKAEKKAMFAYVFAKATTKGDFTAESFAAAAPLFAAKDVKFTAASCPVFKDATSDSKNTKGDPVVIATLPAATSDTTFSYAQFTIAGEVGPATAKWETSDKITMNLVLKIEPSV